MSARSAGEGCGAMFEVVLPIRAVAPVPVPDASPGTPPPAAATVIAGRLQGAHILIVDDQDDARELVATVLEDAGARVTQASSASAAIEALAATDITAIISDVGMPFQDGYSLIQRVRATAARALPALALTAFARVEDRDRALAAGFDEHLAKPIEPALLVTAVARMVRR